LTAPESVAGLRRLILGWRREKVTRWIRLAACYNLHSQDLNNDV
jgi:hypothetical protein